MVRALGGWSGGGSTSDDYGSGFTPERLYGAIQAVRYDGLDLSHLCLRRGRRSHYQAPAVAQSAP
jgi:hypothetical protein